jgi:hypothetical protein
MAMSQPDVLAVFSLFLCVILLPYRFTHATDGLSETVFVVGPEPQPVIFDDSGSAGSSMNASGVPDDINMPFPSISDSAGGRKLKDRETWQSDNEGVLSRNFRRNTAWKPETESQLHRRMRNDKKTNRSLLTDECKLTNTILSVKFDDNLLENGVYRVPPTPSGAAGMSRLVAVVSSVIEVREKNGNLVYRDGIQDFFSAFPAASDFGAKFFDPKVIYDEHQGRFVIVVLQQRFAPEVSRIWLAVSKDETPNTVNDWYSFYIDSLETVDGNKVWADFPGLEVDEEAVYITTNMYRFSDIGYVGVRLWWFSKGMNDGFYSGKGFNPLVINPFATSGVASTTMPAQLHGSSGADGTIGNFFTTVIPYTDGRIFLQVYTLFNPLGPSPTRTIQSVDLGVIDLGSSALPLAPQLGTSEKITAVDARVLDAVWRDNKLWVVFTVNPQYGIDQGQATVHWVRLSTTGGYVIIEAQGNLGGEDISSGTFTYFPSVSVNSRGVAAYGYSASSSTTYAGAYVSTSLSDQSYVVKSGLAPYVRKYGGGMNEWGVYSGISVDPTDDSFWVFNQYADTVGSSDAGGNGRWATAWGRLDCNVRFVFVESLHFLSFAHV